MFLKRFEAKGFKSFADHTVMNFNYGMTGIVGPNGSGKSNIIDGFKWVLGEQSLKQLRGKQSVDFIFSGSEVREPANYAEVSLTFDNSSKLLKTPLNEITVTRRLTRGIQKNEYFINGEEVLLSDIKQIFIDTGLSKGSLGIISQGTVAWFTEAKAIERRKIFEDASGIGKYNKIKKETNTQLNQTQQALHDAEISLNEVQKNINRLSKQAEKAQIYLAKKEQLKQLEVTILARDLLDYQNRLVNVETELQTKKASVNLDDETIKETQQKLELVKEKFREIDEAISVDNLELTNAIQKLNQLQNQKNNYTNELESQLSSDKLEEKIQALNHLINVNETEIKEYQTNLNQLKQEVTTFNEIKSSLKTKHDDLLRELNQIHSDYNQKKYQHQNLLDQIANKYRYDYGIKAVLAAKNSLGGIYDVLSNLITVRPHHEQAINLALGHNLKNIVVQSAHDAKNAINFLKKNRAGAATFLPINDLKMRHFPNDHYDILNHLEGFVGMGNELVQVHDKFQPVIDALLNRIIIAQDLESGLKHRQFTNGLYRIITLGGENISAMGAISGGYNKKHQSSEINLEHKAKTLEEELTNLQTKLNEVKQQANEYALNYQANDEKLLQKNNSLLLIQNKTEQLINQLNHYKNEYAKYNLQAGDVDGNQIKEEINNLTVQVVEANQRVERLQSLVKTNTNLKSSYSLDISNYENELRNMTGNFQELKDAISELEMRVVKINHVIENTTNLLLDNYEITPEYAIENFSGELSVSIDEARVIVRNLHKEIKEMGNVNLEAAEELQNLEADFNYKKENFDKIQQACLDLEKVIAELNEKAIKSFSEVINKTNERLPSIFKYLFGGGTCEIVYDTPDNILESGIEIHAHLPGKTISNLLLFSGGEKTLIALSVLFAVLQVSSLPLVILDEAESALDNANAERFGNIIRNHSDKTQFLTISHRTQTMERCHMLFGVTMMIKGISKVASIDLKKAMEFIGEQV